MIYSLQTNTIIKLSHQFLTVTINYKIKKNQYKLPMLQELILINFVFDRSQSIGNESDVFLIPNPVA
jgi:hypothetical protein